MVSADGLSGRGATNKNGVGYGRWTHIDGVSEGVIRYIIEAERRG